MRRSAWLLALALLAMAPTAGQAQGRPIWRMCLPDSPFPPFLNNDASRLGLSERMMRLAAERVGLDLQLTRLPIARCRALVQEGAYDSFVAPESAQDLPGLRFPRLADGSLDAARRMVEVRMLWVQRRDATWGWDGRALSQFPNKGLVGFRQGYLGGVSAARALGVAIDQSAVSADQLLRLVALGRFAAAVLIDVEAESAFQRYSGEDLRMLDKPLRSERYFAAVSSRSKAELAQAWWEQFALLRDSAAFKP